MNDAQRLARVGLCATCRHARRIVSGKGSEFWRCGLAETDPRYKKYPALPKRDCSGHAPDDGGAQQ